jgi:hypothetical protein
MLIRPGTLLLQHFALSWLLPNFESFYFSQSLDAASKLSNLQKRSKKTLLFVVVGSLSVFLHFSMHKNVLNHFSKKYLSAFYAVKKWSTNASNSFLKRKMGAFASTNSLANQPIRGLPLLGLIWQSKFTNSSQKRTINMYK